MTEHATYYERADHCTIPLFEKQQIVIVASEMEKVTIWINNFLFHLRDLSEISRGGGGLETEGGSQLFETAEEGGIMKNGPLKGGGSCKYVSVIM